MLSIKQFDIMWSYVIFIFKYYNQLKLSNGRDESHDNNKIAQIKFLPDASLICM